MGDGDPAGVAIAHAMASGIGGMRTSGDLVARMQMTKGMKIGEAKKYVAEKLRVSVEDLTDAVAMREVREDFKLGTIRSFGGYPKGLEVKHHVADLLGININCLDRFRRQSGLI